MGAIHRRPDFMGPEFTRRQAEAWYRRTSKATLAEALMNLCALDTGNFDDALDIGTWLKEARNLTEPEAVRREEELRARIEDAMQSEEAPCT